jgi:formylglycine-generating enzyme required for sulfatase activity
MYPIRFLALCCFCLLTQITYAQNDDTCYKRTRQKGIDAYNAQKFKDAIFYWETAKGCGYVPANNDLNTWIKKANDKLNPPKPVVKPQTPIQKPATVNPGISAEDQKKREAAIRLEADKKQREQADETAWKYAQRINTVVAYQIYLDDYPSGKYTGTARQKIKDLTPANIPPAGNTGATRLSYEPEMIAVTGGTFSMGCKDGRDTDCYDWEKPAHSVTLKDFQMGKYEVTQAQWRAVMGSDPPGDKGCDQCPVKWVSWNDIQDFLQKLNAKTNKKYRLPTEAEWEYAARGGNQSKGYLYTGSDTLSEVAWYRENAGNKTHPVGQKKANELGLYDMSGNVMELCSDWFSDSYYAQQGNSSNPIGAATGSSRVLRGCGWSGDARSCRAAFRYYDTPSSRNGVIGFRVAL